MLVDHGAMDQASHTMLLSFTVEHATPFCSDVGILPMDLLGFSSAATTTPAARSEQRLKTLRG